MGWFKIWDSEWLENNSELSKETKGCMVDAMCCVNRCIDNGRFSFRGKSPLLLSQILTDSGLNEREWNLLVESDFVKQVDGYWIVKNWKKYQSEYERQKGYRKRK
jgi:hypothetical protein